MTAVPVVSVSAGRLLKEEIHSDNELLEKHNLYNCLSLSQVGAKILYTSKAS